MSEHLIGLLLGTEDDWPRAFEALVERLPAVEHGGERHVPHRADHERAVRPARQPRYALVIDRLGWWYDIAREWIKKCALMDDVYLLNNPFTFQAMEKHSAYCAMIRLGLKVPETWMVPHKLPAPCPGASTMPEARAHGVALQPPVRPRGGRRAIGYPLYMKPFDGGQWVGVTRIQDAQELHAVYDGSGERLMHLQASVEGFDVFVRSLSIGAETMVMHFEPDAADARALRGRPRLPDARDGLGGRDDLAARERVLPLGVQLVRDARPRTAACTRSTTRTRRPDVALTSLHYYFPWAMETLVKWCVFCVVTGRQMAIDQDQRTLLRARRPRRPDLRGEAARYRRLVDDVLRGRARTRSSARTALPALREQRHRLLRRAGLRRAARRHRCARVFPAHEHEAMVARHRALVGAG